MTGAKLQTSIYNEFYKCKKIVLTSKSNICENFENREKIRGNADVLCDVVMRDETKSKENNGKMKGEIIIKKAKKMKVKKA